MMQMPVGMQEIHQSDLQSSGVVDSSLNSSDTPEASDCIMPFNCLAANFNLFVIFSHWSVSNSELTFFLWANSWSDL